MDTQSAPASLSAQQCFRVTADQFEFRKAMWKYVQERESRRLCSLLSEMDWTVMRA